MTGTTAWDPRDTAHDHPDTYESDQTAAPVSDPWRTPGPTFYEMYVAGDLPWPRESLFSAEEGDVALEYIRLLEQIRQARTRGDDRTVRRLRSEIDDARYTLDNMGAYSAAFALSTMADYLDARIEGLIAFDTPGTAAPDPTAPPSEATRFGGPAPFYLRGRTYVRSLASAFQMATFGRGDHQHSSSDQLLRAVEATTDVNALHDFVAGIAREVESQLRLAHEHSRGLQQTEDATPTHPGTSARCGPS